MTGMAFGFPAGTLAWYPTQNNLLCLAPNGETGGWSQHQKTGKDLPEVNLHRPCLPQLHQKYLPFAKLSHLDRKRFESTTSCIDKRIVTSNIGFIFYVAMPGWSRSLLREVCVGEG